MISVLHFDAQVDANLRSIIPRIPPNNGIIGWDIDQRSDLGSGHLLLNTVTALEFATIDENV
jgi:hypothetical protein